MNFEFVIVDEATQALEPEIIMCLIKKTKHLVLVGDKYQLGSMVSSETAKDLGLDISMIERFEDISIPYKMLNVQYRMDPLISKFSNETFYNNQIKNFHSSRVYKSFTFPSPVKGTTFFYNIGSLEEYSGSGGSYVNRYEAQSILSIIKYMKENQVPADEIGVITFYDGQKGFLINFLQKNLDKEYADGVEIMSVDASQGREKGFIILSCVRSNERLGVGFLSEFRRLNVAMTRAKYGLVVCGNAKTLLANELWNCLVQFFNDLGLVYGGPLECLKQEKMKIRKVKRFIFNRQYKYDD
jgi:regulator of nonsense transcripts 1